MDNQWWHDNMSHLAQQLPKGVLNEMRKRILSSNIQKEKLILNENTDRMRAFFEREIKRHANRRATSQGKQNTQHYIDIIRTLLGANRSLAAKCRQAGVELEQQTVWGTIKTWH